MNKGKCEKEKKGSALPILLGLTAVGAGIAYFAVGAKASESSGEKSP